MEIKSYIDLHSHSYCSDGTFSPEGLVILGKKQKLAAMALTDHDTLDGLALFHEAGKKYGLKTISGIEFGVLSDLPPYHEIHILGLCFNENSNVIQDKILFIQNARIIRNHEMCEKLTQMGLPISIEELESAAGGEIITRAHFANVMLKKSFIKDRNEAFSKYISPGLPGYVERKFLSPKECIKTIKAAGGVAVLAHPTLYKLNMEEIEKLCLQLQTLGLDGIEVRHSSFSHDEERQLEGIAARLGISKSGGSDFHGDNKPDIQVGIGKGNLHIPYSYLEELQTRILKD